MTAIYRGDSLELCLRRVSEHLERRNSSASVRLLWRGYMQAMLELELVPAETHSAVLEILDVPPQQVPEGRLITEFIRDVGSNQIVSPVGDEFVSIIRSSIAAERDSDPINLLWQGYLMAMQEWCFLEINDFDYYAFCRVPRRLGSEELNEIAIGFSDDEQ